MKKSIDGEKLMRKLRREVKHIERVVIPLQLSHQGKMEMYYHCDGLEAAIAMLKEMMRGGK